jgi:low affinity Fe/Cu permease
MNAIVRNIVRFLDDFAARPIATLLAFGLTVIWAWAGPAEHFGQSWQLLMTTTSSVVTLLMVFVISSAQKRNTDALHLKLDMLVAGHPLLTNSAVGVEQANPAEVAAVRQELAAKVAETDGLV